MGNAGRNGGEYYTPRPLIRAIIQVVKPKIGDRIYDGACGSAGFLCESYEYLRYPRQGKLTTKELEILQKDTFTGKEKKSLAYVIAIMNMILHGIDAPCANLWSYRLRLRKQKSLGWWILLISIG
jgi:type I restriction enzyme M protein